MSGEAEAPHPRRSICGYCFKLIMLPADYVFPEILKCPQCKAEWLPLSKFAATEPDFPEMK